MPNSHFLHVSFPFEIDLESEVRASAHRAPNFNPRELIQFAFDINLLPAALQQWLQDRGLRATYTMGFYTPPHRALPPHLDTWFEDACDVVKLNWQYGAPTSRMFWYKPRPQSIALAYRNAGSHIGTPYCQLDMRDLVLVESTRIGRPTVVNSGVPHSVINATDEQRYVLCATIRNNDGGHLSWDRAVEVFSEVAVDG